jgi:hypothetical protein
MGNLVRLDDAIESGALDERLARCALRDLALRFGPGWQTHRRQDEVTLLVLGACAARSSGAARGENSPPDRMSTAVRVCDLACALIGVDLGEAKL